jgi:hypothetical protein
LGANVVGRWRREWRQRPQQAFVGNGRSRDEELSQRRRGGVLREGIPMRYRAIQEHDRRYPIRLMCRALAVSAAGY